jgi:hypothetical protein
MLIRTQGIALHRSARLELRNTIFHWQPYIEIRTQYRT